MPDDAELEAFRLGLTEGSCSGIREDVWRGCNNKQSHRVHRDRAGRCLWPQLSSRRAGITDMGIVGSASLIGITFAENLNSALDPSTARWNAVGKSLVEGKSVRFREILQLREVDLIEQRPQRVWCGSIAGRLATFVTCTPMCLQSSFIDGGKAPEIGLLHHLGLNRSTRTSRGVKWVVCFSPC